MPDTNGFVTFDGPAGTLPPGSQVLVVNTGTGEVASFTADNDGAVSGTVWPQWELAGGSRAHVRRSGG